MSCKNFSFDPKVAIFRHSPLLRFYIGKLLNEQTFQTLMNIICASMEVIVHISEQGGSLTMMHEPRGNVGEQLQASSKENT